MTANAKYQGISKMDACQFCGHSTVQYLMSEGPALYFQCSECNSRHNTPTTSLQTGQRARGSQIA